MEKYEIIKEVGKGSFGSVYQALNKQNGEVVAIKKMNQKYFFWEDCMNLREVKSLRKVNNHPNIIKLKEVISQHDTLYFVLEFMERNLYELMTIKRKANKGFTEGELKKWCVQIFRGLAYMHQRGYFHRDLKPENLLVLKDVMKIADFGLAREIDSQPPYTEYVSTRWYRAPEMLLCSSRYGPAVDMWAMGAIMAELFTLSPLFPGSNDADEMYKICSVIGSPTEKEWPQGHNLAAALKYQFPQVAGVNLSALIPSASPDAINLIRSLCSWDPSKRPSAEEVLKHPFFQTSLYVLPSLRNKVSLEQTKNGQDEQKYPNTGFEQPARYRPQPLMKKGLCELGDALSNMTIDYGKLSLRPQRPPKGGEVWHGQSHQCLVGRSPDMLPYMPRKIVPS